MSLPALFIRRPVAAILLALGLSLAGFFAYRLLPVAALPRVDFPTSTVSAQLSGASLNQIEYAAEMAMAASSSGRIFMIVPGSTAAKNSGAKTPVPA